MESAPLPALDLDAATALALPLAPTKAPTEFRFCFDSPDSEATWLLCRLCLVEPRGDDRYFYYCVVLRPENAGDTRIAVTYDLEFCCGRRKLNYEMTPAQAKRFDWPLFAQGFNDAEYEIHLARYWKIENGGATTLLRFWATGLGAIMGQAHGLVSPASIEHFRWKRRHLEREVANRQLLRTTKANFGRQIRARLNNEKSELRIALRWVGLSAPEKDEIAFACERGSWEQLREVAAWVLTVRLAHQRPRREQTSAWRLVSYEEIEVRNNPDLDGDEALARWHSALAQTFGAHGLGAVSQSKARPHGMWKHIDSDERSFVEVAPPSMHEALEAQLKLRDWTHAHFAPAEAARLLELL